MMLTGLAYIPISAKSAEEVCHALQVINLRFREINAAKEEQSVSIAIEDLVAGADITDRPVYAPQRIATLFAVGILTQGAPAGIDNANTCVCVLKDGDGNAIVTKTFNTANQPATSGYSDLGTLHATNKTLAANEAVTFSVTQGATADMPAFLLILSAQVSSTT